MRSTAGGEGWTVPELFRPAEECHQIANGHGRELGDVAAVNLDGKRLGPEACPVTGLAVLESPEPAQEQPIPEQVRAGLDVAKEATEAGKTAIGDSLDGRSTWAASRSLKGISTGKSSSAATASNSSR